MSINVHFYVYGRVFGHDFDDCAHFCGHDYGHDLYRVCDHEHDYSLYIFLQLYVNEGVHESDHVHDLQPRENGYAHSKSVL